jgi:hypothetical protein
MSEVKRLKINKFALKFFMSLFNLEKLIQMLSKTPIQRDKTLIKLASCYLKVRHTSKIIFKAL